MKKIIFLIAVSLVFSMSYCKVSKNVSGPVSADQITNDVKSKLGPGSKVVKITKNEKYTKNNVTKVKVILTAKKDGERDKYKLIYTGSDGNWKLANFFMMHDDNWQKK